ncbi:MAG: deoxynucleotide monophosphate kinase [Betaproteobacteria bacterium]|nr:MAG: deoxynucleotide monophosphate kinase [Betaproteobacteria bacterium]
MRLIGLHGRAGAGKDTIATVLGQLHAFSRLAIAGPIKDGLIAMLGLSRFELEDPFAKEKVIPWLGKSPRQLMQSLGTEWARERVHTDIWLRRLEQRLAHHRKFAHDGTVVTDVRFENEADWIRRQGGEIWHVLRPNGGNVVPLHASEHALPIVLGTDSVIDNAAGLDQLRDQVRRALEGECIVHAPAA